MQSQKTQKLSWQQDFPCDKFQIECVHHNIGKSATNARRTAVAKPMPMKKIIYFFLTYLQRKALLTNYMDIFQIINTVSRSSRHFADHLDTFRIILILPDRLDTYQIISIDKPARLSFTCSLDLLLISIKQI